MWIFQCSHWLQNIQHWLYTVAVLELGYRRALVRMRSLMSGTKELLHSEIIKSVKFVP